MLRRLKDMIKFDIQATDGKIGHVHNFYFDAKSWDIRYLVADIGGWIRDRKVLISPVALGRPEWRRKRFPVMLAKSLVKNSPDIDLDKPVSRQKETELHAYFRWAPYWAPMSLPDAVPKGDAAAEYVAADPDDLQSKVLHFQEGDPHLRSFREVIDYRVFSGKTPLGLIKDMIVDDTCWRIRYLVIALNEPTQGQLALLAPGWIDILNWRSRQAEISLTPEQVRQSPEFNPGIPLNREFEASLYDFHQKVAYWHQE